MDIKLLDVGMKVIAQNCFGNAFYVAAVNKRTVDLELRADKDIGTVIYADVDPDVITFALVVVH